MAFPTFLDDTDYLALSIKMEQQLVDSPRFRASFRSSSTTTTMSAASHVAADVSPERSTPCLDYDSFDYNDSPLDDLLATPDMSESSQFGKFQYHNQMCKDDPFVMDASHQYPLPTLDTYSINQRPLLSELPPPLPPWPHSTIAPKDAFPDYQEVTRFLQEQARPTSPSTFSTDSTSSLPPYTTYHDTEFDLLSSDDESFTPASGAQPTPSTSVASPIHPITPPAPARRVVGKKAKREDDEDYAPAPKRRMPPPHSEKGKGRVLPPSDDEDDEDNDVPDLDDESGDFRPVRRLPQVRRKPQLSSRGGRRQTTARPKASKVRRAPRSKSNRGNDYLEGPCNCQEPKCVICQMTCFYTFVHGPRKGEVCKRVFESGRHLDLKRHKATHAVQEFDWLENGVITLEQAHWYAVVFEGKYRQLLCPNGDCSQTFTRYDALKRHMDSDRSCRYVDCAPSMEGVGDIKAMIIQKSDEKRLRFAAAKAAGDH